MLSRNPDKASKLIAKGSRPSAPRSKGTASANDPEQDYHDRDNQENVDEAAHGDGRDQSQKPQDDQDDGDGIKHVDYPFVVEFEFP